jgi:putative transposase
MVNGFNGRLRDECLNEHWFTSGAHARAIIEDWRREYNDERPKKALGGLTPTAYAQQLTKRMETAKVTDGGRGIAASNLEVAKTLLNPGG